MKTIEVKVRRSSVVSLKTFEEVVNRLTETIGRPEMISFHQALRTAGTGSELEGLVRSAIGPSELMEFARFDAGEVLRKESAGNAPRILRLVVGNPLIMKEMARRVPDAASYAPVSILIDEREDGVHLSYDSMASLLAPYGNPEALAIAQDLDSKIERLLSSAAA